MKKVNVCNGFIDESHIGLTMLDLSRYQHIDKINIKSIYLEYNELETLPATVFRGFDSVEKLYLQHNLLSSLSVGVFDYLPNLQCVSLHNNL